MMKAWFRKVRKPWLTYAAVLGVVLLVVVAFGSPGALPSLHTPLSSQIFPRYHHNFTDLLDAYKQWDEQVGCATFRRHSRGKNPNNLSIQTPNTVSCSSLKQKHVAVHVKGWTWLPDSMENIYACGCGLTCMWTKSDILADVPDVQVYESITPPNQRNQGEPLRAYIDLEAGRKRSGYEDIFISYHAGDDIQATYAGTSFHIHRNYVTSPIKRNDILVYWSSSRCLHSRDSVARELLSYLPHHSFGKCLNNVGGENVLLHMYPDCTSSYGDNSYWANHLHCAMSHYKFVLAIENTLTQSYVTEKLFYALDAGAIPIYFGAPNVGDLVPPNSIIEGSKFKSMESLAQYVKEVASDPVLYAGYHAWRRCGVMGNYYHTRAVSLDSLPCRLCGHVSKIGGKSAPS